MGRGLLVIAGERNSEVQRSEGDNVYAAERYAGSFRRVISLPEDVDSARVDARLRDGLLHITVAKRKSSRPRQITVY